MKPEVLSSQSMTQNEKGIALLMVLWIITLLAVVCAEFSWTMRTETSIVKNYKEGEQAYYCAEAGINRAIVELLRTLNSPRRLRKADEETEEEPEQKYWESGAGPYQCEFEGGTYEVEIEDEGNKINLNIFLEKKNIQELKKLLTEQVGLEGEERDIVADSMIDWRDKDHNITGINGAEDDYYKSLDTPYECRDGRIPVVEELLLVRGITEEIFYGKVVGRPEYKTRLSSEELERILTGRPQEEELYNQEDTDNETAKQGRTNIGLANIFSAVSGSRTYPGKLNINTASLSQLLMLKGVEVETAREIIKARKERKFEGPTDRLPHFNNYEVWKNYIKTGKGTSIGGMRYFKIKSRGVSPDGFISRKIACEVMLAGNRSVILSWKVVE